MTALVPLAITMAVLAWPDPPQQPEPSPAPSAMQVVASLEAALTDAIAKAEASVVAIHRTKAENGQETLAVRGRARRGPHAGAAGMLFGGVGDQVPGVIQLPRPNMISFDDGAGVVVGDSGQILTAYHVVRGASQLIVRAVDHQEFEAEIIAADPRIDLAVIVPVEIAGQKRPKLTPIPIGDAAKLRKGTFLVALGNPFNAAWDGSPSASWGILSNVARRLEADNDESPRGARGLQLANFPTLLQLDSKLNLGMSGGAVINLKGELVGLTTMASSPSGFDAMAGYAIPMDKLGRRAVEQLKQGKEIEYGLLGIQPDLNVRNSNRVGDVRANSPALNKLIPGDEILAVDDRPVTDFDSLILAVNSHSADETVKLKVRRGDDIIEKTIVLAKFPVEGEVIATNRSRAWRGLRVDYSTIQRINNFEEPIPGVIVTDVEEGSPGSAAGIKKGQKIRRVGETAVNSPRTFAAAVAGQTGPVTLDTDAGPVTVK